MKYAALVRRLVEAGATAKVVAIALEAIEEEIMSRDMSRDRHVTKLDRYEKRLLSERVRKSKSRSTMVMSRDMSRDRHVTSSPLTSPSFLPSSSPPIPPLITTFQSSPSDLPSIACAVANATRTLDSVFEGFWRAYPKRDGANPKAPAKKKFAAIVKSGTEAEILISAAGRYAAYLRGKGEEQTPFVCQAVVWLNQSRWTDYPAAEPAKCAAPVAPAEGLPTDEELRRKYSGGLSGNIEARIQVAQFNADRASASLLRQTERVCRRGEQ